MKRLLWLLVVIVGSAGALSTMAPAWLVDRAVRAMTHERLGMENVAGTVWNGSGDLVAAAPHALLAPGLHWSLAAAPLLGLRAEGSLWQDGVSDSTTAMHFSLTRQSQALRDVHVRIDAAGLHALLMPGPWRLQGPLEMSAPEFIQDAHGMRGTATLAWHIARLNPADGSFALDLGEVRANCSSAVAALACAFNNQGGDAQVQGLANWSAGEGLRVQGQARATATLSPQLATLLQQLGQRAPDGAMSFAFSAR